MKTYRRWFEITVGFVIFLALSVSTAAGGDFNSIESGGEAPDLASMPGAREGDVAWDIKETSDGGYVIAGGRIVTAPDNWDVLVIRLDSQGGKKWEKTYGGELFEWGEVITQVRGGGFILAGSRARSQDSPEAGIWVLKLDSDGKLLKQSTLEVSGAEEIYGIRETSDGGIILTGFSSPEEDLVSWAVCLDPRGKTAWELGVEGYVDQAVDHPGGFLLTGWKPAPENPEQYRFWFMELDPSGKLVRNGEADNIAQLQIPGQAIMMAEAGNPRPESAPGFANWLQMLDAQGRFLAPGQQ